MAQRKPYNPNTKYGRRKAREQYAQHYDKMSPEEKAEHNSLSTVLIITFLVIVGGIVFFIGGSDALFKFLRP